MSRLDEIKARAEQVHWTSTSIEQAMAPMASSAADVPWLLAEVARLTAERDALAAQVAEAVHLTDVWVSDLATDAMVNVMDGAVLEAINEQMKRLLDLRDALTDSDANASDTQPIDQEKQ